MSRKVLFTHSYFYQFDPKQWKTAQPYPPLGTITAAAYLRQNGFDISLFDTNLVDGPELLEKHLESFEPEVLVIYDDGFNYLTKMCLTNMREAAFEMLKMAKSRGVTTVVCSSDSTDHAHEYLNEGADFVIKGEGEESLLELLNTESIREVYGVSCLKADKLVENPARRVLKDLDKLSMAAWDLVDIEPYRKIWMDNHGYFSLNLATTRGCPYKCNWCAKPIYGNRYNSRSPQRVAEEVEYLVQNFQPDYFWMCDDIFGLKPGWVQDFSTELKQRNLNIRFKIQSRVDLLLRDDTIDALVKAGLDEVWLGAESGSQKILDAMDKGTQVGQIHKATELLKSKGVKVCFFIQFGYLGESKGDISKTLKLVKTALPHSIGVSVSYPLPGTGFYEKVKQDLISKSNWSDSDDLDTMYHSPFSSSYYKTLHRFIHKMFRREKARFQMKNLLANPGNVNFRELASALYYEPMYLVNWVMLKLKEKPQTTV